MSDEQLTRIRIDIAKLKAGQKATWAILLIVLAVVLSNVHVGVDPTIHLHLP
jgi:hypothetical protein